MNSKIAPVAASLFVAVTLIIQSSAQADTFGTGTSNQFTVDFVNVGNTTNTNSSLGYGAVPYEYRIGTYEISQLQVSNATELGLVGVSTTASTRERPAASATWYEAAAFVNFLNTNSGKTVAYDLTFSNGSWSMNVWSSAQAWQLGGENLYRNKDAFYFLPSENEWFKAAFYDPDTSTYFDYPLGSDEVPKQIGNLGGTGTNEAVYFPNVFEPGSADATRAGGLSPYGAMGLAGNVWDWVESAHDGTNNDASENRTHLGGAYGQLADTIKSDSRPSVDPTIGDADMGFRVASVPEPSTYVLVLLGAGAIYLWKRRRSFMKSV